MADPTPPKPSAETLLQGAALSLGFVAGGGPDLPQHFDAALRAISTAVLDADASDVQPITAALVRRMLADAEAPVHRHFRAEKLPTATSIELGLTCAGGLVEALVPGAVQPLPQRLAAWCDALGILVAEADAQVRWRRLVAYAWGAVPDDATAPPPSIAQH